MPLSHFIFALITLQPSPSSLKADALAVAHYMSNELRIDSLVIHGESIGGMAAAGAASQISTATCQKNDDLYLQSNDRNASAQQDITPNVSLLICDRTFCNLEATAQRLVGTIK